MMRNARNEVHLSGSSLGPLFRWTRASSTALRKASRVAGSGVFPGGMVVMGFNTTSGTEAPNEFQTVGPPSYAIVRVNLGY